MLVGGPGLCGLRGALKPVCCSSFWGLLLAGAVAVSMPGRAWSLCYSAERSAQSVTGFSVPAQPTPIPLPLPLQLPRRAALPACCSPAVAPVLADAAHRLRRVAPGLLPVRPGVQVSGRAGKGVCALGFVISRLGAWPRQGGTTGGPGAVSSLLGKLPKQRAGRVGGRWAAHAALRCHRLCLRFPPPSCCSPSGPEYSPAQGPSQ